MNAREVMDRFNDLLSENIRRQLGTSWNITLYTFAAAIADDFDLLEKRIDSLNERIGLLERKQR